MSLAGKRVLTIDDDPSFRILVKKILEAQGVEVKEAPDLMEAEGILASFKPDAILLDMNLEGDSHGHHFLEERQKNPTLQRIPIIVCSAEAEAAVVRRSILLGADDYLLKPLKQTWLLQRLNKHVMKQKLLSRRFGPGEMPQVKVETDAQIVGLCEGHCILRSQTKYLKDAKIEIGSELFTQNGIHVKQLRVDGESRAGMQGLFDTQCTLLGVTEKETTKIRQLKTTWRVS